MTNSLEQPKPNEVKCPCGEVAVWQGLCESCNIEQRPILDQRRVGLSNPSESVESVASGRTEWYCEQRPHLPGCTALTPDDTPDALDELTAMTQERDSLRNDLDRLKSGQWTTEEVNDICHNLHSVVNARQFADGCTSEQRKLYGCAPDADRVAELQNDLDNANRLRIESNAFYGTALKSHAVHWEQCETCRDMTKYAAKMEDIDRRYQIQREQYRLVSKMLEAAAARIAELEGK